MSCTTGCTAGRCPRTAPVACLLLLLLSVPPVQLAAGGNARTRRRPDVPHLLRPSPAAPFVFYHIDKAAGSSLRAIIDAAAAKARLGRVIPCHGGVTCLCAANFRVAPLLCPPAGEFAAAAVVAGHFSRQGLAGLVGEGAAPRTCLILVREPLARHASYYKYYGLRRHFANRSFASLGAADAQSAVALSGGTAFMTKFLACRDEVCSGTRNATADALSALASCHVGTTERFDAAMAFLALAQPWLGAREALAATHENRAGKASDGSLARMAEAPSLRARMPEDAALYQAAQRREDAQLAAAAACDDRPAAPNPLRSPRVKLERRVASLADDAATRPPHERARLACCIAAALETQTPAPLRDARCAAFDDAPSVPASRAR